jgi:hypothetical protein
MGQLKIYELRLTALKREIQPQFRIRSEGNNKKDILRLSQLNTIIL